MAQTPSTTATVTYADAGVDIDRANRTKKRIKYLAHKTFTRGVLSEIGGFGGLFSIDKAKYVDPVLVSSVDGVGTKLKIAFEMNIHHTIGADLVNHCVNDIAVQGAAPLFFMDYLATGKLEPEIAEKVIEGLAEACKHNGCALIGGETAEMPGFYPDGEYDLAGFIVGVVERERIITGKAVQVGDVILGLASNGLHTNGYSLARKLLFEVAHYTPDSYVNELKGKVGNELHAHPQELLAGDQDDWWMPSASPPWPTSPAAASPKICRACCPAAWPQSSRWDPGRCCRSSSTCRSWATFPRTKCCAPSTWDWACCWWCRRRSSRKRRVYWRDRRKGLYRGQDRKGGQEGDVHVGRL